MHKLDVKLGNRGYPIHIGAGLVTRGEFLRDALRSRDVLLVTSETVGALYAETLTAALRGAASDLNLNSIVLPDGEEHKTLATAARIWDTLVANGFHRDVCLLALGGGVVGDITGFVAACYQRGVDYIQIPTTLLAQVDSSVGGKTAVNHPGGKNLIGAFHQPVCVIADTSTLNTLDDREFRAGLAEVIKYGLILDPGFLDWLEQNMRGLLNRDGDALTHAIRISCETKARIVAQDEREHGARALLNLGHTFGHAIEAGLGYGQWLHGEAVAAGMCMAARFSQRAGTLTLADVERTESLIAAAGLPVSPPDMNKERWLELMGMDKKVLGGRIRLVLLKSLGEAVVTADYDAAMLEDFLEAL